MDARPLTEEDLSAWLDGELPADRAAAVAGWLATSDEAAQSFRRLNGVRSLLRRWDAEEFGHANSVAFRRRVLAAVGETTSPVVAPAAPVRPVRRLHGLAVAASMLLAVGALAYGITLAERAEDLHASVASLRSEMAELAASPQGAEVVTPVLPKPPVVAPLDLAPLGEIIRRDDASEESIDWETAFTTPDHVYESHGGLDILRQAIPTYEQFVLERRSARYQEQQRSRVAAGPEADTTTVDSGPPARLASWLGAVSLDSDEPASFGHMQVWPVRRAAEARTGAALPHSLEPALKRRRLRVVDTSADTISVENVDRKRPILLLAGDLLSGGRQDRVVARDVLVPPGEQLTVATHANGDSRRRSTSRHSEGIVPAGVRAQVVANTAAEIVEASVAQSLTALASVNRANRVDAVYENARLLRKVNEIVREFEKGLEGDDVVGLAFTAGSDVLGVEVFGTPELFAEVRSRVVRSYALEAYGMSYDERQGELPTGDQVRELLASARTGVHEEIPAAVGTLLGSFVSLDDAVIGQGLFDGAGPLHALVVPRPDPVVAAVPSGTNVPGGAGLPSGADPAGGEPVGPPRPGPERAPNTGTGGIEIR